MIPLNDEQLKRYRHLLSLQLRRLPRDRCAQARYDSSDIVQSVLLKAHKNRANFRGQTEAELVGWLQTILKREVIEFWRRLHADKCDPACERQLQQDLAESSACLENYLADKELSPSEQAVRNELLLKLAEAIEQLPEDQRDVVILRGQGGASVAEIAEQLGRSQKLQVRKSAPQTSRGRLQTSVGFFTLVVSHGNGRFAPCPAPSESRLRGTSAQLTGEVTVGSVARLRRRE